jgi:hypothetical protein
LYKNINPIKPNQMHTIQINYKEFKECQWTNTDTGEIIVYNEKFDKIFMYCKDRLIDSFNYKYTSHILHACDIAVSEDKHDVVISVEFDTEIRVMNTSFLSMALTDILYNHNK